MQQGSVIIDFKRGWACSNESSLMIERDIIKAEDGSMVSKHTNTIRVMGLMNVIDSIEKGDQVEVVFKDEETNGKQSFSAKVIGVTSEMAVLQIVETINKEKEIIKKIKGGYNYGK